MISESAQKQQRYGPGEPKLHIVGQSTALPNKVCLRISMRGAEMVLPFCHDTEQINSSDYITNSNNNKYGDEISYDARPTTFLRT